MVRLDYIQNKKLESKQIMQCHAVFLGVYSWFENGRVNYVAWNFHQNVSLRCPWAVLDTIFISVKHLYNDGKTANWSAGDTQTSGHLCWRKRSCNPYGGGCRLIISCGWWVWQGWVLPGASAGRIKARAVSRRAWLSLQIAIENWLQLDNFDAAGQQKRSLSAMTEPVLVLSDPMLAP